MNICSFDVFDTCLTRRVAEPHEVFDLIAIKQKAGSNFRFDRQEAEREANRRFTHATLEEIYQVLAGWSGWSANRTAEMMQAELDVEAEQLIPVEDIRQYIDRARKSGSLLAFVSDMYLPAAFLRAQLIRHNFYKPGDLLLVSCEHRAAKADGGLYRILRQQHPEGHIEHTGNDRQADLRQGRKQGISTRHYTWANLTRHEERLVDWAKAGFGEGGRWAGLSRESRMTMGHLTPEEKGILSVSTGVAAPLLLSFVSWIHERATARGIEKLYFLARDGQLLHRLFTMVDHQRVGSMATAYLHVSRIALRFPLNFPLSDADADNVFQGNGRIPLDVIAARLGVSRQQLATWLSIRLNHPSALTRADIPLAREALAQPGIVAELDRVAQARLQRLEAYLRQEGLYAGCKTGVVDLGWRGSLQTSLNQRLKLTGHHQTVTGFYLALSRPSTEPIDAEAFMADARVAASYRHEDFETACELFTQADHGTTLDYQPDTKGYMQPVLDQPDNQNVAVPAWQEQHQRAVEYFCRRALAEAACPAHSESLGRLLREKVAAFYRYPERAEAAAWGRTQFSCHGISSSRDELARPAKTLPEWLSLFGVRRFGLHPGWPQGASARLPSPVHGLARFCAKTKEYLATRARRA